MVSIFPSKKPVKVLHIVESLGTGAVESWLLRVQDYFATEQRRVNWSFYCHLTDAGPNSERVRQLGGEVFASPVPLSDVLHFVEALRRTVRLIRPDVIHMHHDVLSGLYLLAVAGMGCRTIVHIHNRALSVPVGNPIKAAMTGMAFRKVCFTADRLVANSQATLDCFLAGRRPRRGRDLVHYCGIDPAPFRRSGALSRWETRVEWNIPSDAPVLLFMGRMVPEKKPHLLVEIVDGLRAKGITATALFVGDGPCVKEVQELAAARDLQALVIVVGYRQDVVPFMHAADCFVLASPDMPGEGFGLAVVEAQLAGLPVLISHGVPSETQLPGAISRRLSSNESLGAWVNAAAELLKIGRHDPKAVIQQFESSDFCLAQSAERLAALHAEVASCGS